MLAALLLAAAYLPAGRPVAAEPAPQRVVLVTFDGVRTQEFFGNHPDPLVPEISQLKGDNSELLPAFWNKLAAQGVVYGDYRTGNTMTIANPAGVSLPAYQSIFAGATQPCADNECGRIQVETFPERLVRELHLPRESVATFGSWDQFDNAVQHIPGTTYVEIFADGNDEHTWNRALAYLKEKKPRFLYIGLEWSDERAHSGDYKGVVQALCQYDVWLDQLASTLDGMGDMPSTLIVTTDHGRGLGAEWRNHGRVAGDKPIWLYGRGPSVSHIGSLVNGPSHSHLDIRPTIEELFGLCPCPACAQGFPEISSAASTCKGR
jgi:hypothetical protein